MRRVTKLQRLRIDFDAYQTAIILWIVDKVYNVKFWLVSAILILISIGITLFYIKL